MDCNFCIKKGDDIPNFIKITIKNADFPNINKLITTCGKITHIYENPVFPFIEGYVSEETSQMDLINRFYAGVVLDGDIFKQLDGSFIFRACPQNVDYINKD